MEFCFRCWMQREGAIQLLHSPTLLPSLLIWQSSCKSITASPVSRPHRCDLKSSAYCRCFYTSLRPRSQVLLPVAVATPSPSPSSALSSACWRSFSSSGVAESEKSNLQHSSCAAGSRVQRSGRKIASSTSAKQFLRFPRRASSCEDRVSLPLQFYLGTCRRPTESRWCLGVGFYQDAASGAAAITATASQVHLSAAHWPRPALLSFAAAPRCGKNPSPPTYDASSVFGVIAAATSAPQFTPNVPLVRLFYGTGASIDATVSFPVPFHSGAAAAHPRRIAIGASYSTTVVARGCRNLLDAGDAADPTFVPSLPPPADLPLQSPLSASVHAAPQVRRPGSVVRMNEVIRHWWAVPAVGFNSILEVPVYRFEVFHHSEEIAQRDRSQDLRSAALAHDGVLLDDADEAGCIVLPNDIFGLPLRPDILYRCYWFYRCAIAGWTERMQLYKWEWPGSKRKIRPQCRTGMARLGWRKAPGHYEGVKAHPLRPHDQRKKINKRLLWQGLKVALSAKFAQGQLVVVDHFNLQSHKTKYCVQHLRRLLGRRCPSALLVHEGHSDVNDNFRYATAHILAVRRENVEGVNVYNLLKYRQLVITEKALLKLIYNIQTYPEKRGWLPRYATPDGKPAPRPCAVEGWDRDWREKKEREKQAKYNKALLRERIRKWKWSDETKGAIKIPRVDPFQGFRLARFALHAPVMPWEKYEETYIDAATLEEEEDEKEEDDFQETKELMEERSEFEEDFPSAAAAASAAAHAAKGTLASRSSSYTFEATELSHSCHNNNSSHCNRSQSSTRSSMSGKCSDKDIQNETKMEEDEEEEVESEEDETATEDSDWTHLPPVDKYPSKPHNKPEDL